MGKKTISSILTATAVMALSNFMIPGAVSAAPVDVNINLNGYVPPPPGAHVYVDAGRPYYIEREHRVYIEKERKHHKKHHHKEHGREDRGRKLGHHKEHGHG